MLTATHEKTAKITLKGHYPPLRHLYVNVMFFYIIFAVFHRMTAMLIAVYAVVVCLCVCVCVCLSHSGIVSKRLNVGSRKQRRTIAR